MRTLNDNLTPDIERILERALKTNVNERYQSAIEMQQDIDRILEKHFAISKSTWLQQMPLSISSPGVLNNTLQPPKRTMNLFQRITKPFNKREG